MRSCPFKCVRAGGAGAAAALPELDALAVSVVVIKAISLLRQPLLHDAARAELLLAATGRFAEAVRLSLLRDILQQLPGGTAGVVKVRLATCFRVSTPCRRVPARCYARTLLPPLWPLPHPYRSCAATAAADVACCSLQGLLRYLARLAKSADSCSAEGLAAILGPVLLEPQSCLLPVDADTLTAAAVWVMQTLIRCGTLVWGWGARHGPLSLEQALRRTGEQLPPPGELLC